MMLELRPNCECCNIDLPPDRPHAYTYTYTHTHAYICTFECTFCKSCVESKFDGECPNCGGNFSLRLFSLRPIRPADLLAKYPASSKGVIKSH